MIADERRSLVWWGWVGDHGDEIWQRTVEHVQLTVIALFFGCLVSFALVSRMWSHSTCPVPPASMTVVWGWTATLGVCWIRSTRYRDIDSASPSPSVMM